MNQTNKFLTLLAIVSLAGSSAFAAGDKPDATLRLTGKSIAVGIGFSSGSGTLTYKGKNHKVDVDGLSVAKVGISSASAVGKVYNLKKLKDFNGNYSATGGGGRGVTMGGGSSSVTIQNESGVRIVLQSSERGMNLTVGRGGVKMQIER